MLKMVRFLRFLGALVLAVFMLCFDAIAAGNTGGGQINIWYTYTLNDQDATTNSSPTVFYQSLTCAHSGFGYFPSMSCDATEMTSITTPTRTGYTYRGHYTDPNCGGTLVIDSHGSINADMRDDAVLYACWNPEIIQVTLNSQGASTNASPSTVYLKMDDGWYANSTATVGIVQLTTVPTKNSYDFGGYYTETGCSGQQIINAAGNLSATESAMMYAAASTHTLYACWVPRGSGTTIYSITLNPNNGLSVATNIYESYGVGWYSDRNASHIISASIFDSIADGGAGVRPSSNGDYVFAGYWTDAQIPVQVIDSDGYIVAAPGMFTSNTTIYARWDAVQESEVDFNLGAGTGTCGSTTVTATYGQAMPSLNCTVTPPVGYSFYGFWDYSGTNYVKQYYSANLASANTWDILEPSVTLRARYSPISYTVTYKCDASTTGEVGLVRYGSSYTILGLSDAACRAPAGKIFDYWQSDLSGNTTFNAGQTINSWNYTNDVTLTAVFADAGYTVTLNGSGATTQNTATVYTMQSDGVYLDSGYQNKMGTNANPITIPVRSYTVVYYPQSGTVNTTSANTDANYTFNGYYSAASNGTQYIGPGGYITDDGTKAGAKAEGNLTWYAQWASGGGSVTLPTPTRNGYTFNGWYTASTGGTRVGGAGDSYIPGEDKKLYAQWTASDYTLSLDNAGATTNGTATLYTTNGVAVYRNSARTESMTTSANPITVPQRVYTVSYNAHDGTVSTTSTNTTATATFNGYYSASSGGNQYISSNGYITTAGLTAGKGYTDNNATWNAQWTNGSVTLPTPTRSGYVFNGWYTAASGGTLVGAAGASYTPTANITLHAQWGQCAYTAGAHSTLSAASTNGSNQCTYTVTCDTGYSQSGGTNTTTSFSATGTAGVATGTLAGCSARTFTVEYDCGDGTGTKPNNGTATYGSAFNAATNTCTRTGYTFAGWAVSDTNTTWTNGTTWSYAANKTFTATWTGNIYTVTLNHGGATTNGSPSTLYVKYGDGWYTNSGAQTSISALTTRPSRGNNYVFGGYYTGQNGTGTMVIDGGGDLVNNTFTNQNTTIYAYFTDAKFSITTVNNMPAGTMMQFEIAAKGTFYIDWGDGTGTTMNCTDAGCLNVYNAVPYNYSTYRTVFHTYATGGEYTIRFGGVATEYANTCSNGQCTFSEYYTFRVYPGSAPYVAAFNGSLGAIFPSVSGKQGLAGTPSFAQLCSNCSHLTEIPANLFSGVTSARNTMFSEAFRGTGITSIPNNLFSGISDSAFLMFARTFQDCTSLTSLPDSLFSQFTGQKVNVSGEQDPYYMFMNTFSGDTHLAGFVPKNLFAGLIANGSPYFTSDFGSIMSDIFVDTGLDTSCPAGYTQYITHYEDQWSSKVSCEPGKYTITLDNAGATTNLYTEYDDAVYRNSARTESMTTSANPITVPQRVYTVSYNAHDGTVSTTSTNTTATATFNGYYSASSGGNQYITSSGYITTAGLTAGKGYTDNNATWNAQWTNGSVTLPTPTRSGYVFNGWYTAASGGTLVGAAGASYTPTANITLHAQWGQCAYTAGAHSTLSAASTNGSNQCTYTVTCDTGYSQSGGTNTTTSFSATGTAGVVTGTLAGCSARTFTVSFDANNGTGGQSADVTATYGEAMPSISTTAPTRVGYTFKGWYDNATWDANGATQYYTAAGASAHAWDKTSATTLYAGWQANLYNVTLNDGAGVTTHGAPANLYVKYNTGWYTNASAQTEITSLTSVPVLPDHVFVGYFTEQNGAGNMAINSQGQMYSTTFTTQQNTTLYAYFMEPKFTITTTNLQSPNLTFKFGLNAKGTFFVDWGDGTVDRIVRDSVDTTGQVTTYQHTYTTGGVKTIQFSGLATDYGGDANRPTIIFGESKYPGADGWSANTKDLIASISGSLGAIFPTVKVKSKDKSPSFFCTFRGCHNLTGQIPSGLFSGVTKASVIGMFNGTFSGVHGAMSIPSGLFGDFTGNFGQDMFNSTFTGSAIREIPAKLFGDNLTGSATAAFSSMFSGCGCLQSIPADLFRNVTAAQQSEFLATFKGIGVGNIKDGSGNVVFNCSTLYPDADYSVPQGYIPPDLFESLNGTTGSGFMLNVFQDSNLYTTCPLGTASYDPYNYQQYWSDRVSCVKVPYEISLKNQDGTSTDSVIYEQYGEGWYSDNEWENTISSATVPTRSGYTFRGYYTEPQADLTSSGGSGTRQITAAGGLPGNNTFTADANLYSAWAQNCSPVGGANCSLTVNNDGTVTYSATCPNNTGYSLSGNGSSTPTCSANSYTISYELNGGSNYSGAPTSYTYGTGATVNGTPTRSNSAFVGWCTDSGLTSCSSSQTIGTSVTGNKTFYAKWTCNSGYSASGNSCTANSIEINYANGGHGTTPTKGSCTYGESFSLANGLSATGYTFNGWGVNGNTHNGGATLSCTSTVLGVSSGSVTVTGTWTANEYKVEYDCGDGTGTEPSDGTATYGSAFNAATNTCTRTGYTFAGWAVSDTETIWTNGTTWSYASDKTLTATWDANTYTVSFNANGGTGGQSADVTATYDAAMPAISTTAPTRTGYTFKGWYDNATWNASGATQYYTAAGASARSWNKTSATTLYAGWQANTYTVSFNANNGTGGQSANVTATYDAAMPSISTTAPTRTGYTFKGWYDNATWNASGATQYYTAAGASAHSWNKTSATTLYAGWQANTITLNWDENGASAISNGSCTYDGNLVLPNALSKSNYTFNGWKLANDTSVAAGSTQTSGCTNTNTGVSSGTSTSIVANWCANCAATSGASCELDASTPGVCAYTTECPEGYTLTGNGTATPSCSSNGFTVKFNANGGSGTCNNVGCDYDGVCTARSWDATSCGLSNNSKILTGWNSAANGSGTHYALGGNIQNIISSGETTLYAEWSDVSCNVTHGSGTASNTNTNTPTCAVTCSTGYETSGTYSGTQGGTSVSYACTESSYQISYELNGGSNYSGAPTSYTYGTGATVNGTPSRANSTFAGWCTDSGLTSCSSSQTIGTSATGNKTFYAKWSCNSGYSASGNSCTANSIEINYANGGHGTTPTKGSCTYGESFSLANGLSATGYTFNGWGVNGNTHNGGATLSCTSTVLGVSSGSVTVTGTWTANEYKVEYDCGDGTGTEPSDGTATYGSAFNAATNTCTRTGYTFAGWAVSDTETIWTNGTTWSYASDKTLTATWDANTYTVSFNANNGTGGQSANVTATYDAAMPAISTTAPTRTGYTFKGWYDNATWNASGATQYYTAAGASARSWNKTSATTLYAGWQANTYTVSFNANNGAGGQSANVTATYDAAMPSISTTAPTRTGYTFKGWYDNATWNASGATQYYTAAGASARSWNKTSATTLYAGWQANTYTVSFNANNGTGGQSANVTVTYDAAMPAISTTAPTRTGYTFKGWYDNATWNASGATQYYTAAGASARSWNKTSATTLYAGWQANTYTVSYSCGDGAGTPPSNTTIIYNNSFTPAANTCTRTGYGFTGWLVSDTDPAVIKSANTAFTWIYAEDKQLVAQWQAGDYVCASGTYLPANQTTCSPCIAGKYCIGGGYTFNSLADQGITGNIGPGRYSTGGAADADGEAAVAGGYYSTGGGTTATPTATGNGCLTGFSCGVLAAEYYSNGGGTMATPTTTGNGCLSGFVCGACDVNYRDNTATGKTAVTDCQANCAVGQCVHASHAACTDAGITYWADGSTPVSYGTTSCHACPTGTVTSGAGYGANEATDCGRVLHVGAYTLYLRSNKKTNPALHVKVDNETYYGNLHERTDGVSGIINARYGNKTYVICDETGDVCQGL